ncbi:MAG: tRNA (cytidine(34)-2'-O)-methyltransferase [Puniceicoccales bacterium]|nr:tRNA (cytidine(34)-2'-O)-methyltransferase [Puniceicoccales bacterium]
MTHVILFRPEIPQNTGNIGRLCACTQTRLHLIHPLGFSLENKYLKRSGMDYWSFLDVNEHTSWDAFLAQSERPKRLWLLTTHADRPYWNVQFEEEDGILFGNESHGCPDWLHQQLWDGRLMIPMTHSTVRSLNLASSVAIVRYEILRQLQKVE